MRYSQNRSPTLRSEAWRAQVPSTYIPPCTIYCQYCFACLGLADDLLGVFLVECEFSWTFRHPGGVLRVAANSRRLDRGGQLNQPPGFQAIGIQLLWKFDWVAEGAATHNFDLNAL